MDICRSLIFEALTRFRRGNSSTSVRDNHGCSECAHWLKKLRLCPNSKQKVSIFRFSVKDRPDYTRRCLFLHCSAKGNFRKAGFEGQKKKLLCWHQDGLSIACQ